MLTSTRVYEQAPAGVKRVVKQPLRWATTQSSLNNTEQSLIGKDDTYHGGFILRPDRTWHQQPQAGLLRLDVI